MSLRNPKAAAAAPASDDAAAPDATDRHRCMLLADSSPQCVPQHVHRLLGHFAAAAGAATPRQPEICFVLAYAVALESGYAPAEHVALVPLQRLSAASSFHMGNVLELALKPAAYTVDATQTIFECRLENFSDAGQQTSGAPALFATRFNGLVVGEDMILSMSAGRPSSDSPGVVGRSACLSMSRYVLNMRLSAEKPLHQLFRHLDEFSYRLRQELFVPMRQQQVQLLCSPCLYPALDGLPAELYPDILRHLSANDVNKLANVCRTLNASCVRWGKHSTKQTGEMVQK